ncbi:hypothetical protein CEXT_399791 [Caerostris extrusa]|uniref:Uncharacterized protein n=1 Tax=Caerostris extrusa TaxID=172846 RepID=A0AAV4XBK5_CAEEX|nr:hypothetical protein CEXT_399791 [Caerostris extrusa]
MINYRPHLNRYQHFIVSRWFGNEGGGIGGRRMGLSGAHGRRHLSKPAGTPQDRGQHYDTNPVEAFLFSTPVTSALAEGKSNSFD